MSQDIFGIPNITVTDDIYWAHQPKEVRALRPMDLADATALAKILALEGFLIDVPLMVWHWPVPTTMALRILDKYTWIPSALMAPVDPWSKSYDPANPPPGAIKVSIDAKDFPEAADLAAADQAVIDEAARQIGPYLFTDANGNDIYANAAATSGSNPPKVVTSADGKTFDLIYTPGPFGFSIPHYKLRK